MTRISIMKELKQLTDAQICVYVIVKHQRLDNDIHTSFTRIVNFKIVYLVNKMLEIFKQVKNMLKTR